jgi:hypothetical protein
MHIEAGYCSEWHGDRGGELTREEFDPLGQEVGPPS